MLLSKIPQIRLAPNFTAALFRGAFAGAVLLQATVANAAGPSGSAGFHIQGVYPLDSSASLAVTSLSEVMLTNSNYAITQRPNTTATTFGTVSSFVNSSTGSPTSVDIMGDSSAERYFYGAATNTNGSATVYMGWSTTNNPTNANLGTWCKWKMVTFSATAVGYVRVGNTQNNWLLTYTRVDSNGKLLGSDIISIPKQTATTCPKNLPVFTLLQNISTKDGLTVAPAPARQIDPSTTGYLVGRPPVLPSANIALIKVVEAGANGAFTLTDQTLTLSASYDVPAAVEQPSGATLYAGAANFTQAVMSMVPRNNNKYSLFTQHTIANGAEPALQWFEIQVAPSVTTPTILRQTRILNAFNGATSSNRMSGTSGNTGGNDVVITFNKSSSGVAPSIHAASSVNGAPWSFGTLLSQTYSYGIQCGANPCFWGGASATPDLISGAVDIAEEVPTGLPPGNVTNAWIARTYFVTP